MIYGVTHTEGTDTPIIQTAVTGKVSIGIVVQRQDGKSYPKTLDRFVFQRKVRVGKEMKWVIDKELMDFYTGGTYKSIDDLGKPCTSFYAVFMGQSIENCLRTEVAAYVNRGCWCKGDGILAQRRAELVEIKNKKWGPFKPYTGPCMNNGCRDWENGDCNMSGDLYFRLADFPAVGTTFRLHTTSAQSIRQLNSALHEIWALGGGRLMGITAKIIMFQDKSLYEDDKGVHAGTKYVVGIELSSTDWAAISGKMLEAANVFQNIKGQLSGVVIHESDEERGDEIAQEFYPEAETIEPEIVEEPEKELREKADKLMQSEAFAVRLNKAQRDAKIAQYKGRMQELIDNIEAAIKKATESKEPAKEEPKKEPAPEVKTEAKQPDTQPQSETPKETKKPAAKEKKQGGFDF